MKIDLKNNELLQRIMGQKKKIVVGVVIVLLLAVIVTVVVKKKDNDYQIPITICDPTSEDNRHEDESATSWNGEVHYVDDDGEDETLIQEMIYIPGFDSFYEVDSKTTINLGNEESNRDSIYLEYTISNAENEEIFSTELIGKGKSVKWNPSEYLSTGENEITLTIKAYQSEGEEMIFKTYLIQNITIKIV